VSVGWNRTGRVTGKLLNTAIVPVCPSPRVRVLVKGWSRQRENWILAILHDHPHSAIRRFAWCKIGANGEATRAFGRMSHGGGDDGEYPSPVLVQLRAQNRELKIELGGLKNDLRATGDSPHGAPPHSNPAACSAPNPRLGPGEIVTREVPALCCTLP
jgi:hypothetical protein